YTITFTCTNTGGNSQSKAVTLEVALPADIFGTEPEDYLSALLEFATQPAITANGAPPVARLRIAGKDATTAALQQVFGQPFADLASTLRPCRISAKPTSRCRRFAWSSKSYVTCCEPIRHHQLRHWLLPSTRICKQRIQRCLLRSARPTMRSGWR